MPKDNELLSDSDLENYIMSITGKRIPILYLTPSHSVVFEFVREKIVLIYVNNYGIIYVKEANYVT